MKRPDITTTRPVTAQNMKTPCRACWYDSTAAVRYGSWRSWIEEEERRIVAMICQELSVSPGPKDGEGLLSYLFGARTNYSLL